MEIGYFDNLGYLLLSFFITFITGHIVYHFLGGTNAKPVQAAFLKSSLGLWMIVFIYAVIKTSFFTVNLGFFIIILFLCINRKISFRPTVRMDIKLLGFQSGMLILFYTVFYLRYYNPIDHTFHALFSDFPGYAAIAEKLNTQGIESRFPDYLYHPPVRELYHYGDLWLTAFFSFIFRKTALTSFYFIMFPLITTLFSIGLLALINPVRLTRGSVLLGTIFLFVSTLSVFFPKSIAFFNTEWGEFTMLNSPKRTVAGLVILSASLMAAEKKYLLVVLSLLSIVCVYTISAPVAFVCSALYITFLLITRKIDVKGAVLLSLPLIAMGMFLVAYIKICSGINLRYLPKEAPVMIDLPSAGILTYLTTLIKCFAGLVIKLLLGISTFAVLFFLSRDKAKKLTAKIAFVMLVIISGYLVHSILYFVAEANQLYTVTYIPAISILVTLLLAPVYQADRNFLLKGLGIVLLGICFYQNLMNSDKYENKVEREINRPFFNAVAREIPHDTPYRFASIQNSDPNKTEWANFNIYYPYDYFKLYFYDYNPLFLSLDNLKPGSEKKNHIVQAQPFYVKTAPFYIFLQKKRAATPSLTFNDGMVLFIKEANIKYLLVTPGSKMPEQVSRLVVKTIEDEMYGYKLCILQ